MAIISVKSDTDREWEVFLDGISTAVVWTHHEEGFGRLYCWTCADYGCEHCDAVADSLREIKAEEP